MTDVVALPGGASFRADDDHVPDLTGQVVFGASRGKFAISGIVRQIRPRGPRVQVIVLCVAESVCNAAESFDKRAISVRVCPPMLFAPVKKPPAKTFPSGCTMIAVTKPFAFGSKKSAPPVTGSSRAIRLRV